MGVPQLSDVLKGTAPLVHVGSSHFARRFLYGINILSFEDHVISVSAPYVRVLHWHEFGFDRSIPVPGFPYTRYCSSHLRACDEGWSSSRWDSGIKGAVSVHRLISHLYDHEVCLTRNFISVVSFGNNDESVCVGLCGRFYFVGVATRCYNLPTRNKVKCAMFLWT